MPWGISRTMITYNRLGYFSNPRQPDLFLNNWYQNPKSGKTGPFSSDSNLPVGLCIFSRPTYRQLLLFVPINWFSTRVIVVAAPPPCLVFIFKTRIPQRTAYGFQNFFFRKQIIPFRRTVLSNKPGIDR